MFLPLSLDPAIIITVYYPVMASIAGAIIGLDAAKMERLGP